MLFAWSSHTDKINFLHIKFRKCDVDLIRKQEKFVGLKICCRLPSCGFYWCAQQGARLTSEYLATKDQWLFTSTKCTTPLTRDYLPHVSDYLWALIGMLCILVYSKATCKFGSRQVGKRKCNCKLRHGLYHMIP